jgi:hypothetical protein
VRAGRADSSCRRACSLRPGALVAGRMRAFPHGHLSNDIILDIRLLSLVVTFLFCAGVAICVFRSRSSQSQRPAHLGAQYPAARAIARGKLVEALAAAALLAR